MFDLFMMNDELDVVDIRLHTLDPVIEKFVIVESAFTHTGKPKELHFANNRERFKQFDSKIIYLQYPHDLSNIDPWYHENNQRNYSLEALKIVRPSDNLIFVSDADEIPTPAALMEAREVENNRGTAVGLIMDDCMYYMNFVADLPMRGPFVINPDKAEEIHFIWKNPDGTPVPHDLTSFRWHIGSYLPQYLDNFPMVKGGWHFSSLGGIEKLKKKIESCAHWQFNTPDINSEDHILKCMEQGVAYYETLTDFGLPRRYNRKPIDFLPEYVRMNADDFSKYILE